MSWLVPALLFILGLELPGIATLVARAIILLALNFYPSVSRQRYREEHLAELAHVGRFGFSLPKIGYAVRILVGAPKMGRTLYRQHLPSTEVTFNPFTRVIMGAISKVYLALAWRHFSRARKRFMHSQIDEQAYAKARKTFAEAFTYHLLSQFSIRPEWVLSCLRGEGSWFDSIFPEPQKEVGSPS